MAIAPLYRTYMNNKRLQTTNSSIAQVQNALDTYYTQNGLFPCPAPRTAPIDTVNFGKAIPICNTATDGIAYVPGRIVKGVQGNVSIGAVPVRTLGLPDSAAIDGWGHLLTYGITQAYTTTIPTTMTDLFHGAIYVTDSNNDKINNPATAYPGIAVYVIAAANPDGSGAYGLNGTLLAPCPESGIASNNCNDQGVFLSSTIQASQGTHPVTNAFALRAGACLPKVAACAQP